MSTEQSGWDDHPDDADDLMWWLILGEGIFMDGPFESLEEAATALEARVAQDWGPRPAWNLRRVSRAWGYKNFTGTSPATPLPLTKASLARFAP
jgi:hypothetical protein